MSTMRAVRIREFGGPDVLQVEQLEKPVPTRDEVLIKVHAASVNPVDYKTRNGQVPMMTAGQLPLTLGRDVSGVVEHFGPAVHNLRVGDEVYAILAFEHGGYAQYVAIDAKLCAHKPVALDHAEAAAVPLAGITAWQSLFDHAGLQPNQRVLIHGGAGGVGHLAVQLAKAKGAYVYTTVSGRDQAFVRELGADEAIDYGEQRFEAHVGQLDVVLDLVGGETGMRSLDVLKPGGVLVSTVRPPPQALADEHGARVTGVMAQPNAYQLAQITALIDEGRIAPFVDAKYPLAAVADAQRHLENEHTRGKIVLELIAG